MVARLMVRWCPTVAKVGFDIRLGMNVLLKPLNLFRHGIVSRDGGILISLQPVVSGI